MKGDNVLVRLEDGRGFLLDFGSSHYRGAETLTYQVFPPGTPAYRSPEAYQFALNIRTAPVKVYSPGPAEDLFALGITAYRLVTGQYPPMRADPKDSESHVWDPGGPGPRPARELNPCCCEELSMLISRMLSVHPEARGSARELAEALEQAAREAGPEADAPLFFRTASQSMEVVAVPQRGFQQAFRPEEAEAASHQSCLPVDTDDEPLHMRPQPVAAEAHPLHMLPQVRQPVEAEAEPLRSFQQPPRPIDLEAVPQRILRTPARPLAPQAEPQRSRSTPSHPVDMEAAPHPATHQHRQPWRPTVFALAVALSATCMLILSSRERAEQEEARDAGTVAVGDSVLTAPVASAHEPSAGSPIAVDLPSEPLPRQARPDAHGRCPLKTMVVINGGCWIKTADDPKACAESEYGYVYKGVCYVPAPQRQRPATSNPPESRDGG